MGIGDRKALGHVAGDHSSVARYGDLLNGILNRNSGRVFCKPGKGCGPVVLWAELKGLVGLSAVGNENHRYAVRTDTVPVVVVHPGLDNSNAQLFGGVAVSDIVAAVGCGVSLNGVFGNGIDYLVAAVFKSGKSLKAPAPALGFGDGDGINNVAVLQKVYGNGLRTLSVTVTVVVPCLCAGNVDGLGVVGVGHSEGILAVGRLISRNGSFGNGVGNKLACIVLVKAGEGMSPGIPGAGDSHGLNSFAVGVQGEVDAVRTDAVPVALVCPELCNAYFSLFHLVGVGYNVAVHSCPVSRNGNLFHGVNYFPAVFVFGKPGELARPAHPGGKRHLGDHVTVGKKHDCDALRTDAVPVAAVVPDLRDLNVNAFDLVDIGNAEPVLAVGGNIACGDIQLLDGVFVNNAFGFFDDVLKGVLPAGLSADGNGCANLFGDHDAVLHVGVAELKSDAVGAEVVAVIPVFPDLFNGNVGSGPEAGNSGNGESVLSAIHVQIGGLVGGIEFSLNKTRVLNVELNDIAVCVGISGNVSVS